MPTRPIPMGVVKRTLNTEMAETLAVMLKGGNVFHVPTSSGWTAVVTGSGGTSQSASFNQVYTGVTVSSSAVLYTPIYGLSLVTNSFTLLNWDKKLYFIFNYVRQTTDTEAVGRVQIKETNALGALAAKGIGLRSDNFALTGESYGSQLGEVDLGVTLTTFKEQQIVIIHDPSVPKIEWYVEGVLKGTQSTAAKIPSGVAGAAYSLVHSIEKNAATTTADAMGYLMRPRIWQAR